MSGRIDPDTGRCTVCEHISPHVFTNVWYCDECKGPCLTEEGRRLEDSYPKPWDRKEKR